MEKGQITRAHWILFAVAILAAGSVATSYIKSTMNAPVPYRTGGGAPGGSTGGGGNGGGGGDQQQMATRMRERMTQELNLSSEQQAQVKAIQESSAPQMKQVSDNTALTPDQKREQMRTLRTDTDNRIKKILTPEQQTKFDAMQAQRRARFGGGNRGGGGPGAAQGGGNNPGSNNSGGAAR